MIDTGATYSCISDNFYERLQEEKLIKGELPVQKVTLIVAVGRRVINVNKQVLVEMKWNNHIYQVCALVVPGLFTPMILGLNWLRENLILINCKENKLVEIKMEGELTNADGPMQSNVAAECLSRPNQIEEVKRNHQYIGGVVTKSVDTHETKIRSGSERMDNPYSTGGIICVKFSDKSKVKLFTDQKMDNRYKVLMETNEDDKEGKELGWSSSKEKWKEKGK